MNIKGKNIYGKPSGPRIMWMLGENEEKHPDRLDHQARDISEHGFKGVVITPRSGNLDLRDPKMMDILKRASKAAQENNLEVWLMTDPRLASKSLTGETKETLEILIVNINPESQWDGTNPNTEIIEHGGVTWFMNYPPSRNTHILIAGAIYYLPLDVDAVYAFRRDDSGTVIEHHDITKRTTLTSDEFECELTLFGEDLDKFDGYEVIAFPRFRTNFFDYTSEKSWSLWEKFMDDIFRTIPNVKGTCWDEPGFYAESGQYPAGNRIYNAFEPEYGYDLKDNLLWLVLESPENKHVRVRNDYFKLLNSIIAHGMKRQWQVSWDASEDYGRSSEIVNGIHATWHGEFCGLEEMNHGSMDLWNIRKYQTAAFTDVGGAERLIEKNAAPDVIYSLILARSLSRFEPNPGLIYYNMWGSKFGSYETEAPPEIVDYWLDLMNLFNANWLAHAYGYTGTSKKKDLGFGPGYPDHPTWDRIGELLRPSPFNSLSHKSGEGKEEGEKASGKDVLFPLSTSVERGLGGEVSSGAPGGEDSSAITDTLIIYPLESFYAIAHRGGNVIGTALVKLVDQMFRAGYQIDILSPQILARSEIRDNRIHINGNSYSSVILPWCTVMPSAAWKRIRYASESGIPVIAHMQSDQITDNLGNTLEPIDSIHMFDLMNDPLESVKSLIKPTIELPTGALGSIYSIGGKRIARLIPDFPDHEFEGTLRIGDFTAEIAKTSSLIEIEIT